MKKTKAVKKLYADQEFQVGKHSIGWIDSAFHSRVGGKKQFSVGSMPTFQKLPRSMTDAEIESELKPGLCDLGDVLAFLDNAPEECKDGYSNTFYFSAFVVRVYWGSSRDDWSVNVWYRDGYGWDRGARVFSPATGSSTLKSSDTLTLESAIEICKKNGLKVIKEM